VGLNYVSEKKEKIVSRERKLKVSMDIWENKNLRDRFNLNGYKNDVSVENCIREIA